MSKNNNNRKDKNQNRNSFKKSLKIFFIVILLFAIIAGGVLATVVISIIKSAPEIDPTTINASLSETSNIYDSDENLLEEIDSGEYRTFVGLNEMPNYLKDAFISIEDERFEEHMGVDPKGIVVSVLENLKSGGIKRGGSTITQQLVKNVYLTNEQTLNRKIKEAYLALQVEKVLHKDQILEAYLNRNFFGQNAGGVQAAAQTYFSKDVGELTLAESALFAGIVKSPLHYQPYLRVKPGDYDSERQASIGETNVLGEKYILVFNEESVKRQKIVLKKMLELEKITQTQYDEALKEDIKASLNPGERELTDITSYFSDYVKNQVLETLITELDYSEEEAEDMLYEGGLKIYSTVDLELQKEMEDVYTNFAEVILGNPDAYNSPILIDWKVNNFGNIIDSDNKLLYYKKDNLLNEDSNLIIRNDNFIESENGDITINDSKLKSYTNHVDIMDYYTIDDKKNLKTHTVGSLDIGEDNLTVEEDSSFVISKEFLDNNKDFSNIDDNGNLIINEEYFYSSSEGIVQPQSATVILDHNTGQIKSLIGGRDVDGNKILNRATGAQRQPGSTIKPLSVYLPALDNGYTAASAIDDIPFYIEAEDWRPQNSYSGFKGIRTLRSAVEDSGNIPAIKTVLDIGVDTSISYLEKLGIKVNKADKYTAPLALGGMTYGLTPLELTAAYAAIANDGIYQEPIAFTKILDKNDNIIFDNVPKETKIVSPQIAYIMGDILRTNVEDGIGKNAQLDNMVTAGKTGTTQFNTDIWFAGYTPYYTTGVWIGNDSPKITLNQNSMTAASFWKHIMDKAHQGLESKYSFDKPNGIVTASVCTQSGMLPTKLCSADPRHVVKDEIFAQGTIPTQLCDVHQLVNIDSSTNMIAGEYCPRYLIRQRVYIKRTPPYNPADNDGIIPRDYAFNAPTRICTKHGPSSIVPDKKPDDKKDKDEDEDKVEEEEQEEEEVEVEEEETEQPEATPPAEAEDEDEDEAEDEAEDEDEDEDEDEE